VNPGQLIAFEGLDGCGKSTQIERLAVKLRTAGREVVQTSEPTDGEFGRRIRATARSGEPIPPAEELRWFVEDRRAHVAEVIRPALVAGKTVLSDRYYLSTVAYQGARGGEPDRILAQSEAEFPQPDLVLLLEIPPDVALARVHTRGNAVETRFEHPEFLEAVAEIFRGLDRSYLARIDASGSPDEVERVIAECVADRLALPRPRL
jgi:dTMP kinase